MEEFIKSIGWIRMVFGSFIPLIMQLIIISLNIFPELGIKIYSVILPENFSTLIKINLVDLGILPIIIGQTF